MYYRDQGDAEKSFLEVGSLDWGKKGINRRTYSHCEAHGA